MITLESAYNFYRKIIKLINLIKIRRNYIIIINDSTHQLKHTNNYYLKTAQHDFKKKS